MFKEYLKSRLKIFLLLMVVEGVFISTFFLFDMPSVTMLYPLFLSLVLILAVGIIDFLIVLNKHRKIQRNDYPAPSGPLEKDYREIIGKLKEEEEFNRQKASSDYNNMIEYYTVWAHQIKTPIASMRLQIQSVDSDLARRLDGDLNRIEAYVEMVLTFLRKFARDFISKKLTMDFEPTEYKVLSDDKWLSFVIEQVLSNAVKYTKKGGIKVYMDEPGILCIEDTGIGISAEDLPRVFENGYTGFNGREDKRASGIGLYLCKRICDNLGHKIYAESEPGVGTKIRIDMNIKEIGIE